MPENMSPQPSLQPSPLDRMVSSPALSYRKKQLSPSLTTMSQGEVEEVSDEQRNLKNSSWNAGHVYYRLCIVAVVMFGVGIECIDWRLKWPVAKKFTFYTVQSNIILAVFFSLILMDRAACRTYRFLKPCMLVMISITGIVWHVVLLPYINIKAFSMSAQIATHILHTVSPLMTLADYILFDEKGLMKVVYCIGFLIPPVIYLGFSHARAWLQGPLGIDKHGRPFYHWYRFIETRNPVKLFPAWWINQDLSSDIIVIINCLLITMAIIAYSLILIKADQWVGKRRRMRNYEARKIIFS